MMKTCKLIIKQNTQKKKGGRKRYKMEGHKSKQAKKKTTIGGKPQREHEQIKYSNPLGARSI
jgi:hypothetical protein